MWIPRANCAVCMRSICIHEYKYVSFHHMRTIALRHPTASAPSFPRSSRRPNSKQRASLSRLPRPAHDRPRRGPDQDLNRFHARTRNRPTSRACARSMPKWTGSAARHGWDDLAERRACVHQQGPTGKAPRAPDWPVELRMRCWRASWPQHRPRRGREDPACFRRAEDDRKPTARRSRAALGCWFLNLTCKISCNSHCPLYGA